MEGMLTWSVTRGIVSNVRNSPPTRPMRRSIRGSGGPVVDEEGGSSALPRASSRATTSRSVHRREPPRPRRSRKKPALVGGVVGMSLSRNASSGHRSLRGGARSRYDRFRDRIVLNGLFLSGVSESHAVRYGDVWTPAWALIGASSRRLAAVTSLRRRGRWRPRGESDLSARSIPGERASMEYRGRA